MTRSGAGRHASRRPFRGLLKMKVAALGPHGEERREATRLEPGAAPSFETPAFAALRWAPQDEGGVELLPAATHVVRVIANLIGKMLCCADAGEAAVPASSVAAMTKRVNIDAPSGWRVDVRT